MLAGLRYKVTDRKRGEGTMRKCTQQNKAARAKSVSPGSAHPSSSGKVSLEQLQYQSSPHSSRLPAICGDLSLFEKHFASIERHGTPVECDVCGEKNNYKCMACIDKTGKPGAPMHYIHTKGIGKDHNLCFIRHHDERYLGLKRNDCSSVGKKLKDWMEGTEEARLGSE